MTTIEALNSALCKFGVYCPNERDFYPQPGVYKKAAAERHSRMDRVRSVIEELEHILLKIDAQG